MPGTEVIIKKAELETVCGVKSRIPDNRLPEYAFAGRSNVGKSSLINAIVKRRALARTSSSPGKTQTINFYNINDELYLVDLPGYGYTKAAGEARAAWGQMVERYLKRTRRLTCIFLLVDIRHKPTGDDRLMYEWMVSCGIRPVIVATKADKLGKNDKPKALRVIRETFSAGGGQEASVDMADRSAAPGVVGAPPFSPSDEKNGPDIIMTSVSDRTGLDELYKRLGMIT